MEDEAGELANRRGSTAKDFGWFTLHYDIFDYVHMGLRSGSFFVMDCRSSVVTDRLQHRSAVVQPPSSSTTRPVQGTHRRLALQLDFEEDRPDGDSVPVDYRPYQTGIRSRLRKVRANRVLRGVASFQNDIFGGVAASAQQCC